MAQSMACRCRRAVLSCLVSLQLLLPLLVGAAAAPPPPPPPAAATLAAVLGGARDLLETAACSRATPCGSNTGSQAINCSARLSLDNGSLPGSCGNGVDSPAISLWVGGNVFAGAIAGDGVSGKTAPSPPGFSLLQAGGATAPCPTPHR